MTQGCAYLSDEFSYHSARIIKACVPYTYPTLGSLFPLIWKDKNLLYVVENLYNTQDNQPEWIQLEEDLKKAFILENLGNIGLPNTDEAFCDARENFITGYVEGPCQAMVRKIMDEGAVPMASNAMKGVFKGVLWCWPDDLLGQQYYRKDNRWKWITNREYMTDFRGESSIARQGSGGLYHGFRDIDFSEVLPSKRHFRDWISNHRGAALSPENFDERFLLRQSLDGMPSYLSILDI